MPKLRNFSSGRMISEDRFSKESEAQEFAKKLRKPEVLVRVTSLYIRPTLMDKRHGKTKGHWQYWVRVYTK